MKKSQTQKHSDRRSSARKTNYAQTHLSWVCQLQMHEGWLLPHAFIPVSRKTAEHSIIYSPVFLTLLCSVRHGSYASTLEAWILHPLYKEPRPTDASITYPTPTTQNISDTYPPIHIRCMISKTYLVADPSCCVETKRADSVTSHETHRVPMGKPGKQADTSLRNLLGAVQNITSKILPKTYPVQSTPKLIRCKLSQNISGELKLTITNSNQYISRCAAMLAGQPLSPDGRT